MIAEVEPKKANYSEEQIRLLTEFRARIARANNMEFMLFQEERLMPHAKEDGIVAESSKLKAEAFTIFHTNPSLRSAATDVLTEEKIAKDKMYQQHREKKRQQRSAGKGS